LIEIPRPAGTMVDGSAPRKRRRWRRVLVLIAALLFLQPRVGEAGLNPGAGPLGGLAGLAAWTTARRADAQHRLEEAAVLAEGRAGALASANAELAAAAERRAGLLAARRVLGLAGDRARAARRARDDVARRLEGPAAAGVAALALAARRDRDPARRRPSPLPLAAAAGIVVPWADGLGQALLLDGEIARVAGRERELDAGLDEATAELRRLAATADGARRQALDARIEVAEARARRDALARRLGELAERGRLTVSTMSLEWPSGARPRATPALQPAPPGLLRRPPPDGGTRRLSIPARASPRREPARLGVTLAAFGPAAAPEGVSPTGPLAREAAAGAPVAVLPIAGRRVAPEEGAGGVRHRGGILLETALAQTVSAPTAGAVAFAGAFRGFGLLLIIDRGDGYHTLLSGLSRLDVARGATVIAGQAVGAIGVGDGKARLYVELRHRGTPVDPAGWLASREDRVRG
jgi:murein DD-endopeptidase MepM/ murein hydrolase activator NlpD